jgi:magnesium transporter
MITIKDTELLEAKVRQALEDNDLEGLRALFAYQHPADIADIIDRLDDEDQLRVFRLLAPQQAAEVLDETDLETTRELLRKLTPEEAGDILDLLPADDAAEVLSEDVPERQQALLAEMEPSDAADVRALLQYPPHTAGRLMTDRFARVRPDMTAAEVIQYLHVIDPEVETLDNLYAVEPGDILLGVVSLREVILAPPEQHLRAFMTTQLVTVSPEMDQQEVARLVSHYDLSSVPVVDSSVIAGLGRILGIVTVDDVIDVFVEEFSEDYLLMAGSDAHELEQKSPLQVAKLRLPWIMATMFIELLAGVVIHVFDHTLTRFILLASFMPIISAISGNTGLQSAAIIIRGLSAGLVQLSNWQQAVVRQLITSTLLGGACGLVLGTIGAIWSGNWVFGLVVFLGMFAAVNIAGVVGTIVPLTSKRLGFDPALTAGPFETAFQDVIGISIFLGLATALLQWLR